MRRRLREGRQPKRRSAEPPARRHTASRPAAPSSARRDRVGARRLDHVGAGSTTIEPAPTLRPAHPTETDPTAIAAAELTRQLPRLVQLAVAGAKKGKPTVLRAVRGIVRDLQRQAAESVSKAKSEAKIWKELEAAGPLTAWEADQCLNWLDLWRTVLRTSDRTATDAGHKGRNLDAICHAPSRGPDPLTMDHPPTIGELLDAPIGGPTDTPDTAAPPVSK